jgi:hypothetical protein
MRRTKRRHQFLMCVNNKGYRASLERWKVYRALPDREAEGHGLVRVVDESGEDYLYPHARFRPIKLPWSIRRLLRDDAAA